MLSIPKNSRHCINVSLDAFLNEKHSKNDETCLICESPLTAKLFRSHFLRKHWKEDTYIQTDLFYILQCSCSQAHSAKANHYHCPFCSRSTTLPDAVTTALHYCLKHSESPCDIKLGGRRFCQQIPPNRAYELFFLRNPTCKTTHCEQNGVDDNHTPKPIDVKDSSSDEDISVVEMVPDKKSKASCNTDISKSNGIKRLHSDTNSTDNSQVIKKRRVQNGGTSVEQEPIHEVTKLSDHEQKLLDMYKRRQKPQSNRECCDDIISPGKEATTAEGHIGHQTMHNKPASKYALCGPNSSIIYRNGRRTSIGFIYKKYSDIMEKHQIESFFKKYDVNDTKLRTKPKVFVKQMSEEEIEEMMTTKSLNSSTGNNFERVFLENNDKENSIENVDKPISQSKSLFMLRPLNSLIDPTTKFIDASAENKQSEKKVQGEPVLNNVIANNQSSESLRTIRFPIKHIGGSTAKVDLPVSSSDNQSSIVHTVSNVTHERQQVSAIRTGKISGVCHIMNRVKRKIEQHSLLRLLSSVERTGREFGIKLPSAFIHHHIIQIYSMRSDLDTNTKPMRYFALANMLRIVATQCNPLCRVKDGTMCIRFDRVTPNVKYGTLVLSVPNPVWHLLAYVEKSHVQVAGPQGRFKLVWYKSTTEAALEMCLQCK